MLFISLLFFACGDAEEKSNPVNTEPKIEAVQKIEPAATLTKPTTATENTQCDDQLKEYSDFVDEYIVLMEKASKGDLSALEKYPALLEKAEASSKELDVLHKDGSIDADCWKKYNEINNRMTSAAMDMSGASAEDKEELQELQELQNEAVDQAACMQKCQEKTDPMAAATCMQSCM